MAEAMRVIFEKLNNENYQIWKYKMEMFLIKEDLWEAVNESRPATPTSAWTRKNDKARAYIGLMVEDNQLSHVKKSTSAKEAWISLQQYHEKATLTNKVMMLKRLCSMKLSESGDMENHIDAMLVVTDRLTALGEMLPDHLIVALMLCSLPESYNTLITALETRPESDLTLELVKNKLINEYKRRKDSMADVKHPGNSVLQVASTAGIASKPRPYYTETKDRNGKMCFYCKKPGHFKRDCLKFIADKRNSYAHSEKYRASKVTDNGSLPLNVVDNPKCLAMSDKNYPEGWYIDSGATKHMCSDKNFFLHLDDVIGDVVHMPDGNTLSVHGIGYGNLQCVNDLGKLENVKINNVLYVPLLKTNLLSVIVLDKQGLKVTFYDGKCFIVKDGDVLATGRIMGDLYKLNCKAAFIGAVQTSKSACVHSWHCKLGHRSLNAIKDLVNLNLADGIKIVDCNCKGECESCLKGKSTRLPFKKESRINSNNVLDLIHTDICGPMPVATPGGKRYFLSIIDDHSRYVKLFLLEKKSEAAQCIQEYVQLMLTQFGRKPKVIRSDGGGEYTNTVLKNKLKEEGMLHQVTPPYTPQHNGVAERMNYTLCNMVRCMLKGANLDDKYWGEAITTACYIQNRLPTRAHNQTPYELWYKKKPNLKHLITFGTVAYMHIPKEHRSKFDDRAAKYVFVGYQEGTKAYRLLDTSCDRIHISRDVRFIDSFETIILDKGTQTNWEDVMVQEQNNTDSGCTTISLDDEENVVLPSNENLRRSQRPNKGTLPKRYANLTTAQSLRDPKTIHEALNGLNCKEWKASMDEEMESLSNNCAWELKSLPPGRQAIGSKWVFKTKQDANGKTYRYKARLVAQGYSQRYGSDYDEIFAPVVKQATIRTVLTIAGKMKIHIKNFDVQTAFLNSDLENDVYMSQPDGYVDPNNSNLVCHLKKSLYGLKQSARCWNLKIDSVLTSNGFKSSTADPCLYVKKSKSNWIYLLMYVDDLIIASVNATDISAIADILKEHFEITDLGNLAYYLGIQVERDVNGICYIHQKSYIKKLLHRFGLQDAKPSPVPLDPGYIKDTEKHDILGSNNNYCEAIGALLYLLTSTRPDIAASVTILSRKVSAPTAADWAEVKRVLKYLKGTDDLMLCLGDKGPASQVSLIGFADADWGGNLQNRKSNTGFIFFHFGGAISWACRGQSCVALSSSEAEYIALSEAAREVKWLRQLLQDLHFECKEPTIIMEDSQSCLKMLEGNKGGQSTKHIDIKFHFVRDLLHNGIVDVKYCATENMKADLLTKPLNGGKLKTLRDSIGLNRDLHDVSIEGEC